MIHRIEPASFIRTRLQAMLMLVIFALLISACGVVEQDVTIAKNEKWNAETRLILNKQSMTLANPADIERRLDDAQPQYDAAGMSYKWEKKINDDGGVTYIIKASGTGYDLLNKIVFDGGATINKLDENGLTEFSFSSMGDFSDYKLALHVGEVQETNGTVSGKGDVSWHGMGQQMYAVFKPKSGLGKTLPLVGGAILATLLIAGIFYFLRSRSPSRSSYSYSSSTPPRLSSSGYAATNYCYRCGGKLDPNGKFCPHCGAPVS